MWKKKKKTEVIPVIPKIKIKKKQESLVKIDDEKVWVKPLSVITDMASEIVEGKYAFKETGYTFIPIMANACGKQIILKSVYGKEKDGNYVFKAVGNECYWYGGWLTNVDPNEHPEQFHFSEVSTKKEEEPKFVSDFDEEEKELSPAEKFFYGILPQLKEVVVNAYNEEVKSRGEQSEQDGQDKV